tara:strand:+ start:215 stop:502 length:288 start_codon:yes stop_codon:yes gene_type:complete
MTTYNDIPHGGKPFNLAGAVPGKNIVDGAEVPNVTVPTPGEPEFSGNITINTTGTPNLFDNEITARLDAIEAKLDHLLQHAHQEYTLIPKTNEGT